MLKWVTGSHSTPAFVGKQSRSHRRRPLWRLKLEAWRYAAGLGRFGELESVVQFAGFPRSGHSLIGSILDAHSECMVAHELDAMGLIDADFTLREIFALIVDNSRSFAHSGRFWNGFRYNVDGGLHGKATRLRVVGDKKGDWATRRCLADSKLLDKYHHRLGRRHGKWILVVRNPFDNVATLSLRKSPAYDALRIRSPDDETFERELRRHRTDTIAATVREDMVEDYARLCGGVESIRQQTAHEDWLEIRHEALIAAPEATIQSLLDFLDLPDNEGFARRAADLVANQPHRRRFDVDWPAPLKARIDALINRFGFIDGYRFDG